MLTIIIDSKYHRRQFDDWLAGGTAEYKGGVEFCGNVVFEFDAISICSII